MVEGEVEEEKDIADAGYTDLQAKQQAILISHRSESEAEAKHRHRQEAQAEHAAEVDEMITYMDDDKEEEEEPSCAPIYPAPGIDIVDISHDKV